MYPTNSIKHFKVLLLSLISVFFIWIFLGLNFSNVVGINDITHHLISTTFGSNKNPFFSPIYDWLWMGGQLVAPNVGNVPLERFFLFFGFSNENALSLMILFFQAFIFFYSYLILERKRFYKISLFIISLALSFLPTITFRIAYGHSSLFIPILFNLIFIWCFHDNEKSYFSIFLSFFIIVQLFSGPYFQILFYSLIFVWPILLFYFYKKIAKNILLISCIYLSAFIFSADFAYLVFKYMTNGDLFRSFSSNNLIYSYARLKPQDFFDLISYHFFNFDNLQFYFAHEIKVYLGLIPIVYIIYKRLSFKSHWPLYLASAFTVLFIFCPPSLEFLIYKIPFLNLFRIPQRTIIAMVVPCYLFIFHDLTERADSNKYLSFILIFINLVSSYFSLLAADLILLFCFLIFLVPLKRFQISLTTFILVFCIGNIFFVKHLPLVFTPKSAIPKTSKEISLKRTDVLFSNFWNINTNRAISSNSIYGYTHPLPRFRELYTKLFNINTVDLLYFEPHPNHQLNTNFEALYRYNSTSTLVFIPQSLSFHDTEFWQSILKPNSVFSKGEKAFVENEIKIVDQALCSKSITIANENILNNAFNFNLNNMTNSDCLAVIPFNFSNFILATNNGNNFIPFPTNYSQIGVLVRPGTNQISLFTDDNFYWNLKLLVSFLGLFSIGLHLYFIKKFKVLQ